MHLYDSEKPKKAGHIKGVTFQPRNEDAKFLLPMGRGGNIYI